MILNVSRLPRYRWRSVTLGRALAFFALSCFPFATACGTACPTIACPEEIEFTFSDATHFGAPRYRIHLSDSRGGDLVLECLDVVVGSGDCVTTNAKSWSGDLDPTRASFLRDTEGLVEGELELELEITALDAEGAPLGTSIHMDMIEVESQLHGSGSCEYECLEAEPLVVAL